LEVSREYLEIKIKEYQANAERYMRDSFANDGAAQALVNLLNEMDKPKEETKCEPETK